MTDRGTFHKYIDIKYTPEVKAVLRQATSIIEEYESQGMSLTLRQLYYQFVTRNWIANKQEEYNRLGRIINNGRLTGHISWTALEDRGRSLMGYTTFDSPQQAISNAKREYKIDRWANQPYRPEVWVEKQAMEGVLSSICGELRVDFFCTKGYNSQSEQWRAGRRMAQYIQKGQRPIIFHLADHDPSGFDMTIDLTSRFEMFVGMPVIVQRIALNSDHIHKYSPPPNPAKETDSRFKEYEKRTGTDQSWELDSLEPSVIRGIIRDAVTMVRDPKLWDEMAEQESDDMRVLEAIIEELTPKRIEDEDDV